LVLMALIALCPTLHARSKRHQGQVIGYFTESGAASGKYPVKKYCDKRSGESAYATGLCFWPRSG
jgi:hypothetical protein